MTEMNENPNVYAVPYPTEPVAVPQMPMEVQPQPPTEEPTPKKKTNAGYRVFAAILAVAAIAVAFLFKFSFLWLNLETMGITKELNRQSILETGDFFIADDGLRCEIIPDRRVGIGYASQADQDRLWRFKMGPVLSSAEYTNP